MKNFEIGISNIGSIHLEIQGDKLRIDDDYNAGVIICNIKNLRKTIYLIEEIYKNHQNLDSSYYGYNNKTVNLSCYQTRTGKRVCEGNYIEIRSMPKIIKMLKSVKAKKCKYILSKDNLFRLSPNELVCLQKTMQRRKKVLTDNNGCNYIEV